MSPPKPLQRPRLICVYNADTGLIEALKHAVHKAVRPETYPCSLCALTYGAVSMRGDWKRFWRSLDADVDFYHRDDFTRDFPALGTGGARQVALPVILVSEAGEEPRVAVSSEELDAMADVDELMARVGERLSHLALALSRVASPA
ncbi:MAG: hypothetical protein QNI87_11735 [Erythrobacter sp.]|uniref:hypothetical protein n=1 Tax=Erythrobacter sp. TaxID=1042 RepID=UPI00263743DD|nr:hypothetical protein [Erythrobacter sp.]MDJ0979188.1 hypothetical protein [Erythrobacter sp.]